MTTPALSMYTLHSICDPITCNVGLMQSNLGKSWSLITLGQKETCGILWKN